MIPQGYFGKGAAVVTGAGSGLGAAMATRFAAQGMPVAILDIDYDAAIQTARTIEDAKGTARAYRVDVSDRSSIQAAAHDIEQIFGHCSVLCANVGVQQFGAADRLTDNDWRWVLNVNVMGTIDTVNAFLPLIRKSTARRHIVITSSSAAYSPGIRMAAYTTSKYAITGYAETLRMELASEDIGVSILFPAGMSTTHLQSSQKARPAEFGVLEIKREDIDAMMRSRKVDVAAHLATAEVATRHLLQEIAENRRYIITHGDCQEAIVSNYNDLLAAHERAQLE
jgi:NAD(P)-dependent dehydrogenase (short-subunit alcohol dehydrogenase family)